VLVAEVVTCKSGGLLDPGRLALCRLHFLHAFFMQSYHEKQEMGPFWNCLYFLIIKLNKKLKNQVVKK